jgi:hypothetical protein
MQCSCINNTKLLLMQINILLLTLEEMNLNKAQVKKKLDAACGMDVATNKRMEIYGHSYQRVNGW